MRRELTASQKKADPVAFASPPGTTSRPNSRREIGTSLRLATATGMPTIVIAKKNAVTMCPSASSQPTRTIQSTLPMRDGGTADDGPAERPQHEAGQLERLQPERDRDDQQAHHNPGEHVGQRHPEPAQDQPEDVQDGAQFNHF
jgi:hypothetical protein